MKLLSALLGVLCAIAGGYCIVSPVETFANLGWILGVCMIIDGVGSIVSYIEYKGVGKPSVWALVGGVASVVLGIIVSGSLAMQIALDFALAYLVAFWLIFGGVCRIAGAIGMHRLQQASDFVGGSWVLMLIMGILVVIAGIRCLIHPIFAAVGVGILIGVAMISFGISFLTAAFVL